MRAVLSLSLLFLLAGCAAPMASSRPGGSCLQSCEGRYFSCMDANGSFDNPQAQAGVAAQCERGLQQCQQGCR